jgi:flagellar biosynthetic protein FliR
MAALTITSEQAVTWVASGLWPFFRVVGLAMTAPLIGTRSVPARIRLSFAIAISMVIVPVLPPPPAIELVSGAGFLVTLQQVLIGAGLGLAVRLVFLGMELGGQIIAQQMGLGFAAMVDPQNGAQVPVVSQYYLVLATFAFLSLNGHLVLIEVLTDSFRSLPVGPAGITRTALWSVMQWASWTISSAVMLALPAISSLMVVNIALAVISRVAPQFNLIAIGFPFMILFGALIVLLTTSAISPLFEQLFQQALVLARQLAAGG